MIGFALQYIDSPAYLVYMWDVMSSELPVKGFVSIGDGLLFGAVIGYAIKKLKIAAVVGMTR